jgi:hypothetical protein
MQQPMPMLDDKPFTDQTRRYHKLQDERAANWWRIGLVLVILVLAAVINLTFQPGPWHRTLLLRLAITILAIEILVGCCLLVADQSFRQHENSRTNLDWNAADRKGQPDWTASFHAKRLRRSQMFYYIGGGLGAVLFVAGLWM